MPLRRRDLVALSASAVSCLALAAGCSGVSASIADDPGEDGTNGATGGQTGGASTATSTSTPPAPGVDAGGTGDAGGDATTGTPSDGGASGTDSGNGKTTDAAPPSCTALSATTAPQTLDTSCFTSSFADDFSAYDISSGTTDDGKYPNERWFNGTDECCMNPSNGWPGVMYPTPSQTTGKAVNPYSLLPGGGLQISATQQNNEWFSGVMTSVDGNENGFAQTYGYFEMTTQLPAGTGTWPSFWMLSLPRSAPGGEIDIFEQYGCNPPLDPAVEKIFHFTLHDWKGGTTPLAYTASNTPDLTAAYHRYGMLWNRTYMALYLDGQLLTSTPTPSIMIDVKYFLLADLGIGGGWDTTQTPTPSNMLIKSINAYTVPGF